MNLGLSFYPNFAISILSALTKIAVSVMSRYSIFVRWLLKYEEVHGIIDMALVSYSDNWKKSHSYLLVPAKF